MDTACSSIRSYWILGNREAHVTPSLIIQLHRKNCIGWRSPPTSYLILIYIFNKKTNNEIEIWVTGRVSKIYICWKNNIFHIYSEALLALPALTGFKQEAPSPTGNVLSPPRRAWQLRRPDDRQVLYCFLWMRRHIKFLWTFAPKI